MRLLWVIPCLLCPISSFVVDRLGQHGPLKTTAPRITESQPWFPTSTTTLLAAKTFETTVDLPEYNNGVQLQATIHCAPVLSVPSELVEVRHTVPFGLDVSPQEGLAVCTKSAAGAGAEQAGDVLRYTSQWTLGLPRGVGVSETISSFAGGLTWQCSLFDVLKDARTWEEVVQALTSNTQERTDEVVLIFERALPQEK